MTGSKQNIGYEFPRIPLLGSWCIEQHPAPAVSPNSFAPEQKIGIYAYVLGLPIKGRLRGACYSEDVHYLQGGIRSPAPKERKGGAP